MAAYHYRADYANLHEYPTNAPFSEGDACYAPGTVEVEGPMLKVGKPTTFQHLRRAVGLANKTANSEAGQTPRGGSTKWTVVTRTHVLYFGSSKRPRPGDLARKCIPKSHVRVRVDGRRVTIDTSRAGLKGVYELSLVCEDGEVHQQFMRALGVDQQAQDTNTEHSNNKEHADPSSEKDPPTQSGRADDANKAGEGIDTAR